jgi:hypothetical protein
MPWKSRTTVWVQYVRECDVLADAEGQIEIGPAVALTADRAADGRAGDDTRIGLGQLEQPLAHPRSVRNENRGRSCQRRRFRR